MSTVRYVRIAHLTYLHLGSQSALSAARSLAQQRAQRASRSRKEAKAYTRHGEDDMAARSSALERTEVSVVALDEVGAQRSGALVRRHARCGAVAEGMHASVEASGDV